MGLARLLSRYCYSSRDHRGGLFDVRLTTGAAGKALTGMLAARLGVWAALAMVSGYFSWRSWIAATKSGLPGALEHRWQNLGYFAFMISIGLIGLATEVPRERKERSEGLAARGLCGGCGYDLTAIGTGPDGCKTCPECGTGWRARGGGGA